MILHTYETETSLQSPLWHHNLSGVKNFAHLEWHIFDNKRITVLSVQVCIFTGTTEYPP